MLVASDDSAEDSPRDSSVHDLIDAYARALPDAPAVLLQGRQLTFGELWRRVDRVAQV